MRGRKIDNEFVSNFIDECAKQGLVTSDKILEMASEKINEIDLKIREVEDLKKYRKKLVDVKISLDRNCECQ